MAFSVSSSRALSSHLPPNSEVQEADLCGLPQLNPMPFGFWLGSSNRRHHRGDTGGWEEVSWGYLFSLLLSFAATVLSRFQSSPSLSHQGPLHSFWFPLALPTHGK